MTIFIYLFFCLRLASAAIPARVELDLHEELKKVLGQEAEIEFHTDDKRSTFTCAHKKFKLSIYAPESEQSAAAYAALRDLGFLYPHPRISIRPEKKKLVAACGKKFSWHPRLKLRGFHLHLEHSNEWVDGFFMGNKKIAENEIWWLVRNGQNLLQLEMIRMPDEKIGDVLNPLVQEARSLGLKTGLCFSFTMIQQHSYRLIPLWRELFHWHTTAALLAKIRHIVELVPTDFMAFELGSSEFTPSSGEKTIEWMNAAASYLHSKNMGMLVKSHVSSNQKSKKFGNFNFLPHFARGDVGVEAHTVFFYGLEDSYTPMYGRKNFADMEKFMLDEKSHREIWYFPETSYWVGMDIDVPIFLTDYLLARTADVDFLERQGLSAQLNFSSGQELGYWLMDWQVALLADERSKNRPTYALELLGESSAVWKKILYWQEEYLKRRQLIQTITTTNLIDELSPLAKPVHERNLLRDLHRKPMVLATEIGELEAAVKNAPSFAEVKNPELQAMLEVTLLRLRHVLSLRKAIQVQRNVGEAESFLKEAASFRLTAQAKIADLLKSTNRYPESWIYELHKNPTSYGFGYLWTAKTLFYWEREEKIVREKRVSPFFDLLVNPFAVLF